MLRIVKEKDRGGEEEAGTLSLNVFESVVLWEDALESCPVLGGILGRLRSVFGGLLLLFPCERCHDVSRGGNGSWWLW